MQWSQEGSEDEKVVKLMAKHGTQESYELFLRNAAEEKWMKRTGLSTSILLEAMKGGESGEGGKGDSCTSKVPLLYH